MRNKPWPVVVAATVRLRLQILVAKISLLGKVRVVEREKNFYVTLYSSSGRESKETNRGFGYEVKMPPFGWWTSRFTTSTFSHAVSLTFCSVYVETSFKHFVHKAFLCMSMSESCTFSKGVWGGGGTLWMLFMLQFIWFASLEIRISRSRVWWCPCLSPVVNHCFISSITLLSLCLSQSTKPV